MIIMHRANSRISYYFWKRAFHSSFKCKSKFPTSNDETQPFKKTFRLLKNDIKTLFTPKKLDNLNLKSSCDILIVGGGVVGSAIAYWLKYKARSGLDVVVVEKDLTYSEASTVLSVGGLRQQFSLPENIQMSLFAAEFFRKINDNLGNININFTPYGYLTLATDQGAETLVRNSKLQNELGARNEILTSKRLKEKFPWLNTNNIALGCHGLEKEGWFDPWALLMGFKKKAQQLGAHYVNGEAVGFEFENLSDRVVYGEDKTKVDQYTGLNEACIKLTNGETKSFKFAICVIAAGAQSGGVAKLAKIGTGGGILKFPLPVEPRKRYVYVINSQGKNLPGLQAPLTIDPNGTYFRRDGLNGNYLCGRSPKCDAEPSIESLDMDYQFFEREIWPTLAERVKAFESIKVVGGWAGFYEYNIFDENGIIGAHPYYNNLYIATGFSGHGIQQAPAAGLAISELIVDGQFRTIDLTRLGFDRILMENPLYESNIV